MNTNLQNIPDVVNMTTMARLLGVPRQGITGIESFLLRSGLIVKDKSVRVITEKGRDHISQGNHSQGELSNG
jgi:Holliday junction resolvasome RuvABC ATP-dependent DNA helicase subunit